MLTKHTACSLARSAKKRCNTADFSALPLVSAEPKLCAVGHQQNILYRSTGRNQPLVQIDLGVAAHGIHHKQQQARPPQCFLARLLALLGRGGGVALDERLGEHSAQRGTLAVRHQHKTPGQQLPVIGRSGCRFEPGEKLRVVRVRRGQAFGQHGLARSDELGGHQRPVCAGGLGGSGHGQCGRHRKISR